MMVIMMGMTVIKVVIKITPSLRRIVNSKLVTEEIIKPAAIMNKKSSAHTILYTLTTLK